MPAINFMKRYAAAIEAGTKTQTIRKPRKDGRAHCQAGDTVSLYTGMRTRSCRKLKDVTCLETAQLVITEAPEQIFVNGSRVTDEAAFVKADGFNSIADFYDFFAGAHGLPFHGTLITWTDTKGTPDE